ncbi:hypothetical protein ACTJJ4_11665 [Microbacterium sp. 22195]|uniref:hypothetical protein n=1 Tax=Microbacterium sp. 22195 TaxID=3453891 RepID=UPI003F86345B
MKETTERFGLIGRLAAAYSSAMAAALEKFAAEMSEVAKSLPDREYWRGYEDGRKDENDKREYRTTRM